MKQPVQIDGETFRRIENVVEQVPHLAEKVEGLSAASADMKAGFYALNARLFGNGTGDGGAFGLLDERLVNLKNTITEVQAKREVREREQGERIAKIEEKIGRGGYKLAYVLYGLFITFLILFLQWAINHQFPVSVNIDKQPTAVSDGYTTR